MGGVVLHNSLIGFEVWIWIIKDFRKWRYVNPHHGRTDQEGPGAAEDAARPGLVQWVLRAASDGGPRGVRQPVIVIPPGSDGAGRCEEGAVPGWLLGLKHVLTDPTKSCSNAGRPANMSARPLLTFRDCCKDNMMTLLGYPSNDTMKGK